MKSSTAEKSSAPPPPPPPPPAPSSRGPKLNSKEEPREMSTFSKFTQDQVLTSLFFVKLNFLLSFNYLVIAAPREDKKTDD